MDKFVPYEKLSKKKKRQLDAEKRGSWYGLNPITRRPKNPKAYDRKKARCWRDDSGNVLSSYLRHQMRKSEHFGFWLNVRRPHCLTGRDEIKSRPVRLQ